MKRNFISIAIVFSLVTGSIGLSACGITDSGSASNEDTEADITLSEIFGDKDDESTETKDQDSEAESADVEITDIEETSDTVAKEEGSVQEDIVYDVENLSEEQQNMLLPMDSRCMSNENNDDYILEALYLLFVNYSDFFVNNTAYAHYDTNLFYVYVDESFVHECASIMFDDFDGTMPAISYSSDTMRKEDGYYYFGMSDRGDEEVRIISWVDHPDGTCTVELQYGNYDFSELYGTYQVELKKNENSQENNESLFRYTITSTSAVGQYILPDSDTRYYTKSELNEFTADELRLARNEIYARHGRIFESEDLQIYFESQSWYQGTIDSSEFDVNVLNEYEKANIKTIESLEKEK